jgi:hypothetical protein
VSRPPPGEGPRSFALVGGPSKDQPLPAVARCRKRQQDVAPLEGLSISVRNGTSWSGRCEVLTYKRSYRWLITRALTGRLISTTCWSKTSAVSGCWPRRSRMMSRGCGRWCRQLVRLKVQLVAIERPDGLLVERLLDAGLRVLASNPRNVKPSAPLARCAILVFSGCNCNPSPSIATRVHPGPPPPAPEPARPARGWRTEPPGHLHTSPAPPAAARHPPMPDRARAEQHWQAAVRSATRMSSAGLCAVLACSSRGEQG